jgi:hypothetical protein
MTRNAHIQAPALDFHLAPALDFCLLGTCPSTLGLGRQEKPVYGGLEQADYIEAFRYLGVPPVGHLWRLLTSWLMCSLPLCTEISDLGTLSSAAIHASA